MFYIEGFNVKDNIVKAMQYGQIVDVMYISKLGEVTQRRIKVLKLNGESFQAYCFLRNTKRTFLIDNVVSLIPVARNESLVIQMALIPAESLPYYESMIYLPMIIILLERDRVVFESGEFKLSRPYINIIEQSIKSVHKDLKETKLYLRKNNMKIIKGERDDTCTNYVFYYGGYEQHRRYLNVRLRNRTEELLDMYLNM